MTNSEVNDGYVTDAPIDTPSDDRFGRARWARRIAETISAQRDPASIVVGIYGPWGDGKTSVLNLIEAELRDTDGIVPVRFNPWRLGDEAEVFRGFFETLADALDEQLATTKEKVGKVLRTYGALLKPVPIAGSAMEGVAGAVGAALSETNLAKERQRIEALLEKHAKRVVILIDDLDRLDKSEIQAMFRLVKVAADFARTAYVLAFDHAVVADALAERYAVGTEHGASFMDKIIQLPLHLPLVPAELLRRLALETVDVALQQAQIQLTKTDVAEFVSAFDRTVATRLNTPRAAKRYGNALLFALPMIGTEVHPVDLMLIEAMRVCYPRLYEWVRTREPDLLGQHAAIGRRDESGLEALRAGVAGATAGLNDEDRTRARLLLTTLFPRAESAWENKSWGADWDATWTDQKRVTSPLYFRRYFSYSVPLGDVADADIDALIAMLAEPAAEPGEISERVKAVLAAADAAIVLQKLAGRATTLESDTAAHLALVVSEFSDRFPDVGGFLGLSSLERAALLVRDLIGQVRLAARGDLVSALVRDCTHLPFAIELIRWLRPQNDKDDRAVISGAECDDAGRVLAARILDAWQSSGTFESLGSRVASSLHVCALYGDPSALKERLRQQVEDDPATAFALMRAFLPRAWSMETGVPFVPEFGHESYSALAPYLDPAWLFQRLQEWFGEDVGTGDKYSFRQLDPDERLAHEYAHTHRTVSAQDAGAPGGT